jgi:hypothetical protein
MTNKMVGLDIAKIDNAFFEKEWYFAARFGCQMTNSEFQWLAFCDTAIIYEFFSRSSVVNYIRRNCASGAGDWSPPSLATGPACADSYATMS